MSRTIHLQIKGIDHTVEVGFKCRHIPYEEWTSNRNYCDFYDPYEGICILLSKRVLPGNDGPLEDCLHYSN